VTSRFPRRLLFLLTVFAALLPASRALALEPDEIALVVNANVPESMQLAQFYAQQRHIPDNRILVLDLPTADEMPNRQYAEIVVPQVRDFLRSGQLTGKVKCFVTFYGVPLRIADRVNTPAEAKELDDCRAKLVELGPQVKPVVEGIEAVAVSLNPDYRPNQDTDLDHLLARTVLAQREIYSQIEALPDPAKKIQFKMKYDQAAEQMLGPGIEIDEKALDLELHPELKAAGLPKLQAMNLAYEQRAAAAGQVENTPWDAAARAQLRDIAAKEFGFNGYVRVLQDQLDYLDPAKSKSCFDSELSLVYWNVYHHSAWMQNPLFFNRPAPTVPTYMVSRLDAPTPELVKSIITTSIAVEAKGLEGRVVLDSLGAKEGDGPPDHKDYGVFDQYYRNLATLLKDRTKLDVYLDEKPDVLPAGSQSDVALYCGWHSAGQYVPACKFVPGAVGYHVASYEMVTLRGLGNNGWVRGLEQAGVVATLGPVEEPFLGAFPRPDEYFPLLLTGKLTATEVYWKTVPWSSWMMGCVGDPLYNPYKNNPKLSALDLPFALRQALPRASQPM
jgi:uncharacterized protein (TIGR03790 family)